jgi:hypothetical protein
MSYVLRVAMGRSIKEKTSAPYVVIITSIAGILLYGCVNSGGGVSVDLKGCQKDDEKTVGLELHLNFYTWYPANA